MKVFSILALKQFVCLFLNLDCIYLCSFTKRGNLQIQHNSSLYFPPNITDISNCLNIFVQSLILTKGPQKTRISQTYMRVWEWVKSVWSPTHCDLAKSGQSHRESGWHEIFEGKIQALLIKAQCAVQWFLHRAPHQVCHIACCALSQLLVRQLTQIPADASDWQISYWQKLLCLILSPRVVQYCQHYLRIILKTHSICDHSPSYIVQTAPSCQIFEIHQSLLLRGKTKDL